MKFKSYFNKIVFKYVEESEPVVTTHTHCHEAPCKKIFPLNTRVAECLMTRAVAPVAPVAPALTVEEAGEVGLQVHPLPDIPICHLWLHSLSHSLLCFLCSF